VLPGSFEPGERLDALGGHRGAAEVYNYSLNGSMNVHANHLLRGMRWYVENLILQWMDLGELEHYIKDEKNGVLKYLLYLVVSGT